LAAGAAAQLIPDAKILDFRIPEYDEDGQLKWVLRGDAAQMVPEEKRVRITGARVEIYRDGKVDMLVRAPECDYRQDGKKAWTDGPVEITARNLTIRGEGMQWDSAGSKMVLERNVHVTILNPKEGMTPEPEPAAPAAGATREERP
jgi:lipopolysaccharide export system protein LptC